MANHNDYSVFNPENRKHRQLGNTIEKILDNENELATPGLAETISNQEETFEENYLRALLTDGSEFFTSNYNIEVTARPEGSGGNPTFFWRLDR